MSLLSLYFSRNCIVAASDDLVSVEENGKRIPCAERSPKFQIIGASLLGAVGRSDCCGIVLTQVRGGDIQGILKAIYEKRPPCSLPAQRDGFQVVLAGYNEAEKRMRVFAFIPPDFAPVELTVNTNCFAAFGWTIESDFAEFQQFSDRLGTTAPRFGIHYAARELRRHMKSVAEKYPGTVGQPSYFAALTPSGSLALSPEFPPAPEVQRRPIAANAENALDGAGRFYVGSIRTPSAGGLDTVGGDDGGTGAQSGSLSRIYFAQAQSTSIFGTGSVTNAENINDGDEGTFGTLDTGTGPSGGGLDYILSLPTVTIPISQIATLYVKSAVTAAAAIGQAAVYYSIDNGNTWSTIYLTSPSTRPLTTDSVVLHGPLNLGRVQVKAEVVTNVSSGQHKIDFYEAWIEVAT